MKRITKRIAVTGFAVAAIVAATGSPAFAHDIREYGPYGCGTVPGSCGYGQVRDQHEIIDACDTKADGKGLEVNYELRNGSFGTVKDPNGSASGCGIKRVGSTSKIAKFQVCGYPLGSGRFCTTWKDA
ncbi:hypothetical protein [Actinoplanes sp. NPDC049118]|uniref:hypothetical protein n=1 Tax=Actinoplanes sp. NPDC049118 TaxID=3155769 RepID=UPI0033EDCC5D